tara:strand:- start:733 stop:1848 length:1116 start_codon:yes stop_codon:yes gene_type:complete
MKILLLVAGGRAGSDFFQSLLDNHSQILQFPGILKESNLKKIITSNSKKKIAKDFINAYPHFFNSKLEKFERWDKLGKKRNNYFTVDKKKFLNAFLFFSQKKNLHKLDILVNLHKAYAKAKGRNPKKTRLIFIHTHLFSWTKNFIKFFDLKKFEFVHTIRHPLSSVSSPIKTWLNFKNGYGFFPKDLYFHLDLAFNCINDLKKISKVHVVQLEQLHRNNEFIMKRFCKNFRINFEKSLKKSTKNGLIWWGDKASKKWISGINKNFSIKVDESFFYLRDLQYIECLSSNIIKKYNYSFLYPRKNFFFNFLPMKCEILVWKNTLKNLFTNGFRWKHLISIPIFYILRLLLLNKLIIRISNTKLEKFPKNIIRA